MRVGLLTFADHANFQFNLNSQEDKVSLLNSLSAGYSPNGKTNTAEALKFVITFCFSLLFTLLVILRSLFYSCIIN